MVADRGGRTDDAITVPAEESGVGILPGPESALGGVYGVYEVGHGDRDAGGPAGKISVEQVCVEQVRGPASQYSGQSGEPGDVPFSPDAEDGDVDAGACEPVRDFSGSKGDDLDVESPPVQPGGEFIDGPFGPRGPEFGYQFAYAKSYHGRRP